MLNVHRPLVWVNEDAMTRIRPLASLASLARFGLPASLLLAACGRSASAKGTLEVYKESTCGCCGEWVSHMRASGLLALSSAIGTRRVFLRARTSTAGSRTTSGWPS